MQTHDNQLRDLAYRVMHKLNGESRGTLEHLARFTGASKEDIAEIALKYGLTILVAALDSVSVLSVSRQAKTTLAELQARDKRNGDGPPF